MPFAQIYILLIFFLLLYNLQILSFSVHMNIGKCYVGVNHLKLYTL